MQGIKVPKFELKMLIIGALVLFLLLGFIMTFLAPIFKVFLVAGVIFALVGLAKKIDLL